MTMNLMACIGSPLALADLGEELRDRRISARLAVNRPPARLIVTGFGGRLTLIVRCLPHESEPWFLVQHGESPEWLCPANDMDAAADRIQQVVEALPVWPPQPTARSTGEHTMVLPAARPVETKHAC